MASNDPILTISVAASLLKLHPRTLMLYEQAGLITPHRTGTNRRLFSIADLEDLQFIKYLTQAEGINLNGVRRILEAISLAEKEGINLKKLLFPSFKAKRLI
ncbi:MerR family transcriptional regulator [Patescibacteria group bacterium]|nr:MerR family transcriptional regulator [Patescibacteria group bacterium]